MSKLEFIDSETGDYFDVLVQVGFEKPLEAIDIVQVLQVFLETTTGLIAANLFEGLAYLNIDTTSLTIRFRYSGTSPSSNPYPGEELPRLKMQFIFYLFAKIDLQYKLADIPFPSDFREFISLPDYL
ncbi:MAG: hypothetical protein HC875_29975 [Anaerolineales bacterium]|nr:hypothetical protein [Anaerolineales bacterium]